MIRDNIVHKPTLSIDVNGTLPWKWRMVLAISLVMDLLSVDGMQLHERVTRNVWPLEKIGTSNFSWIMDSGSERKIFWLMINWHMMAMKKGLTQIELNKAFA
jgi:hypothetical protein